ncbi:replication-relaxation family protein [Sutcliffiella sp. FSL R7-0096]|uniref:replication-relaxation family protein n=1 Tax=Sutcliffiella sp. FSL R7-0096 TaxID=2921670 RepID=UPI00315A9041
MKNQKKLEEILLSLKKCDYLSREQLQRMHRLGKDRNAQRILSNMEEFISYFHENRRKIYYLNAAGREMVQAVKKRKKTVQVNHYLMRNDLYIHKGRPSSWKNEVKISINKVAFIADAVYISNKIHKFIEIDYKQSMVKNVQKIKKYKDLSTVNPHFSLIWVTTTPYRKNRLEQLCQGLRGKVYLWEDLK